MTIGRVTPSGVERTFGDEEIIVSKTDPRGRLTYANDVFLRVSAYDESELIGKPHNVIRHPDMPRAVFKLMWDVIGQGEEIFAYVLNLAGDGAHYWVFAHVTPSFDRQGRLVGYHSNRRSPDRAAVRAIEPVYARLRAEERRAGSGKAALEASVDLFTGFLAERGQSYADFIWAPGHDLQGALR